MMILSKIIAAGAMALAICSPACAMSSQAEQVTKWVTLSKDNISKDKYYVPFMVVDKVNARLYLFDVNGVLITETAILIGSAKGDDSVAGIGDRALSAIKPNERTTPAGRFYASHGLDTSGEDVLWIDYNAAIAMRRASDRKPGMSTRSRVSRLQSKFISDKSVTLGCVNVFLQ